MFSIVHFAWLVPASAMALTACIQRPAASDQATSSTPQDRLYACQMQGAEAEDRVYGPLGDLSVDSALVRARVTEDCLNGRPAPRVTGTPGLR